MQLMYNNLIPQWFKGQLALGAVALAIFGLYLAVKWLLE